MYTLNKFRKISSIALLSAGLLMTGCSEDDDLPPVENTQETITDVTLVFTSANGDEVTATASKGDGSGLNDLVVQEDPIELEGGVTYTLTFEIQDKTNPNDIDDIGAEVKEEDDEHQIFFGFTENPFTDPTGDGNIDAIAEDAVNYEDADANGNPLGLETTWTTKNKALSNDSDFTVRLQHQPEEKTATSNANTGDTDFEITFKLNITIPQ